VALVPGNGDGTFKTAMMFDAGMQPWGLAAGDFNGDGVPDVVTTLNGENAVVPILNKNGTLTALTKLTTGMGPRGVAVGDLNGDGKPDFIVANSSEKSVTVFLNTSQ
jgi:FG-GAP-like repeat